MTGFVIGFAVGFALALLGVEYAGRRERHYLSASREVLRAPRGVEPRPDEQWLDRFRESGGGAA